MRLESFRVWNYRSINDSGNIEVSRITALLGRNESGKSNLLRALHSLNPASGFEPLNPIKDFPRHRRLEECQDSTKVVSTLWILTDKERQELAKIFPRAAKVREVDIGRNYRNRTVSFPGLPPIDFNDSDIKTKVKKISAAVRALAQRQEDGAMLNTSADSFESLALETAQQEDWATNLAGSAKALRTALAGADLELSEKQEESLSELEELAKEISSDGDVQQKARNWVVEAMPSFIYVDEYPELDGHQDINAYLHDKANGQLEDVDYNFQKLCKVAGLKPEELKNLLEQNDQETRNQLANRASAVVTSEIKRLWKDRALKIRFNLDAQHLDTMISDPTATYDVEVNLNERSRGFQWFFAFYITFAADTKGGDASGAVLLLDEPGLYLHAKSQGDLLRHFEHDFSNQILYSTHSPFMVPTHSLSSIRTVSISEGSGTTVTNDPAGDSRTLFPLQAALGYDLAQSMFVGPNNLVVEGVTDYWYLSSVGSHFADSGLPTLNPEVTMTPAGGAQKVSYMVALLTSEELNVLVLLDSEKDAKTTKDELVKSKLIAERNVLFVGEAFQTPPAEADIEDMLDAAVFEQLVKESYAAELKGKKLVLNASIPRIVKRVEAAFVGLGIQFHKTRPARLFLKKMAANPATVLPKDSADRFTALFNLVNQRLDKSSEKSSKPFGA
ncbi:AAA family ATPase [Stenotrophomonas rhizophila]